MWNLERDLVHHILGPEWGRVWEAISHNPNFIKTRNAIFLMALCRNSGEMTTSSTNTLLTKLAIMWSAKKAKIANIRKKVEGDDSLGNTERENKKKLQILRAYMSTLGFDTTCEMEGGIEDGPTFCKIRFTDVGGRRVGYR